MNATQATPRPWHIDYASGGMEIHPDGDPMGYNVIADITDDTSIESADERQANAELIVCAVNAHDGLVEALQLCECELSLYVGLADQSNNPQAWYDAIAAARKAIKAAIQAAE